MRIYLPATLSELALRSDLGPRFVHAVTVPLRAALPDEDDEGLEYAAQLLAADDSLELLDGTPGWGRRRLVLAADVPDEAIETIGSDEDLAPSVVRLTALIGWDTVACARVDERAAEADLLAALADDEDAAERLAERDLLWYDVTEFDALAERESRG